MAITQLCSVLMHAQLTTMPPTLLVDVSSVLTVVITAQVQLSVPPATQATSSPMISVSNSVLQLCLITIKQPA